MNYMAIPKEYELSKHFSHRCLTMRSLYTDDGDKADGFSLENIKNSILLRKVREDPKFRAAMDHLKAMNKYSLDGETTAAINELANQAIDFPKPNAIGRRLVKVIETQKESLKLRLPAKGLAAKTKNAGTGVGQKGTRNTYVTVTPDDEIASSEKWDLNFVEDSDWAILAEETQEVVRAVEEKETAIIIAALDALTASTIASGAVHSAASAGTLDWDDVVDMWGKVGDGDFVPNILATRLIHAADLFKQVEFTNSLQLGDLVNISAGQFGKTILGTEVLLSSLMTLTNAFVLDSTKVEAYVIRRDRMVKTWEKDSEDEFGVKASTRSKLVGLRPLGFIRSEDI